MGYQQSDTVLTVLNYLPHIPSGTTYSHTLSYTPRWLNFVFLYPSATIIIDVVIVPIIVIISGQSSFVHPITTGYSGNINLCNNNITTTLLVTNTLAGAVILIIINTLTTTIQK